MVAEAEIVYHHHHHQQQKTVFSVLDVVEVLPKLSDFEEIEDAVSITVSGFDSGLVLDSGSATDDSSCAQVDIKAAEQPSDTTILGSSIVEYIPTIRSGSYADIGPRRYMEDEHVRIDDLSSEFGSLFNFPKPSAFYGVFDGHGGPEAAAYVKRNVIRLFFEDVNFPQRCEVDNTFLKETEDSLRQSFLLADSALAEDCSVSSSSGTTALTAMIFGRHLVVANAGDCRAVLCRKGEAINMSQDHKPTYPSEKRRVEELGGFIDDGYLNGVLSVTRALGDWDMKLPKGSKSPLIAEPEFKQMVLTEDDEFLILGCDGLWDVMSSQQAVSLVRRNLRRNDDPEQCARDLVREALRLNTFDNLTVMVICLSPIDHGEPLPPRQRRSKCCGLSADALVRLRSVLGG